MRITVNGKVVEVPDGTPVSITGDTVTVGGESWSHSDHRIKVDVVGGLTSLMVRNGDVTVNGVINGKVDAGGSVSVNGWKNDANSGYIEGDVDCGGSINCGDVRGNIDCGGSVNCGSVGGDIDAGGSVIRR